MTQEVAQARSLSQSEVDYWVGQIVPRGRDGVAREFYAHSEARQKRVDDLYREILDRTAEPAGKRSGPSTPRPPSMTSGWPSSWRPRPVLRPHRPGLHPPR